MKNDITNNLEPQKPVIYSRYTRFQSEIAKFFYFDFSMSKAESMHWNDALHQQRENEKKAGPNLTLPQIFCDFWLASEFSSDSNKTDYPNAE